MCSLAWDGINSSFENKESEMCEFNMFSQAALITEQEQHMVSFLCEMDPGSKIFLALTQRALNCGPLKWCGHNLKYSDHVLKYQP